MIRKTATFLFCLALAAGLFGVLPAPSALAATCTSNGTGNWSAATTWIDCNGVPQNGDNVVIASGHTVTLDTNTASLNSLTVNGTLRFDNSGTGRSMVVTGDVTVNSGNVLDVATGGSATTHTMTIGGDLTNNGTFDALPATGRIINVTFNKDGNQTITGSGTTRFNTLTVNMGTSRDNVLDVQSVITLNASANPLVITNGTFKLSSTSIVTPFTSGPTIPTTGGFWLNGGTVSTGNLTWTLNGLMRISSGTFSIGTSSGNSLQYGNNAVFIMEGGTLDIAGRFSGTGTTQTIAFTMSGGVMTVGTVGHNASRGTFDIPASGSSFTMSGGSIVLQNPSTATPKIDYRNLAGTTSITGGVVQFGNTSTPASSTFEVGVSGGGTSVMPSLAVNANNAPSVNLNTDITVRGNVTIDNGTTLTANAQAISLTGNWSNSGTFTAGASTVTFNGSSAQTIGGTASTTFNNLTINNSAGVSLNNSTTANGTLTLTNGLLTLGGNDLTLGTSASIGGTPSAANMIVADGAGSLCKTYGAAGAFTFPIGDNTSGADYSPATLNFTAGTFDPGAQACVRVTDAKHPQNSSVNHYLTRYWTVTQSNIADFDCDAEFNYVDADIVGTESRIYTGKWDSAWTQWALANTVGNLIGDTFGSFSDITGVWPYILVDDPTAITLADFYAQQTGDAIEVIWETASELDNRGFNLYRGTSPDGWDRRLNDALIPSQSQGSPAGFFYTWTDQADLTPGTTYYYWLQDMDLSGALTTHGPVSVDFTVPTAVTLGSVQASPGLDTLRYSTHAAAASLSWLWIVAGAGAALGASRLRRRA